MPIPSESPLELCIPVSNDECVYITGPFPLSKESWDYFLKILRLMKRGLVVNEITPFEAKEG